MKRTTLVEALREGALLSFQPSRAFLARGSFGCHNEFPNLAQVLKSGL